MKKILISMLAVAALVSCSKEESIRVDQGELISFGNAFVDNSTRAAVDPSYGANGEDLTEFKVWGTVNGGNGTVAIFAGDTVEGTVGTGNTWNCTTKTQYWIKDALYNFAALVNATNDVALDNLLPSKVNGFTADGATDLLYARSAQNIKGKASGNGLVDFTFEHLLSKVKFTVENTSVDAEEYSFKVNNIVINGNTTGDVTLASKTWDNLSDPDDYTVAEITVYADETAGTHKAECAQELLLIPGDFNITFNVDIYNGTTKLGSQAYPIAPVVYNQTLQAGYAYNFVIKVVVGEEIKFSVEKQPTWTNGGDITLQ